MEIQLGILTTEVNRVGKSFSARYVLTGELKDSMDISNPTVLVDLSGQIGGYGDISGLFYNITYAYIPSLYRYYFVNKITLIRKNLFELQLHVDVLQFTTFIRHQRAYVSRNENNYNILLPDERRIVKNTKTTTIWEAPNNVTTSLVNTTFNKNLTVTNAHIVLSTIRNSDTAQMYEEYFGSYSPIIDAVGNINTRNFYQRVNRNLHILNDDQLSGVLSSLKDNDNLAGFIGNIIAYPYTVTPYSYQSEGQTITPTRRLYIGEDEIQYYDNVTQTLRPIDTNIVSPLSEDLVVAHFKIHSGIYFPISDFNYLEPYASYELYLPFYGWVNIQVSSLIEHEIIVFYSVNYIDANATVFIYDKTAENIIFSAPCTLGVEIPLSTTNAKEVKDRNTTNGITTVLQLVGSALAVAGGTVAGNPIAVAGGVLAGTKAIGSSVVNSMTNYDRGSVQYNNNGTNILSPTKVYIRRIMSDIQYSLDSTFLAQNGGVCNHMYSLGAITGYTEVAEIPVIEYSSTVSDLRPTKVEEEEIITLLKKGVILPT